MPRPNKSLVENDKTELYKVFGDISDWFALFSFHERLIIFRDQRKLLHRKRERAVKIPGHERSATLLWVHKPTQSRQYRSPRVSHRTEVSRSTIGGLQRLFHGKTRQIKQQHQHVHNLAKVSSSMLFSTCP